MNSRNSRLFIVWCFCLFLSFLVSQFLHECGHGFGSRLVGVHISTGFNRVGDANKKAHDKDFRSNHFIEGSFNFGTLLGPAVNWILALLFTAFLHRLKSVDSKTMTIGAAVLANAFMRFVPMLVFFINALLGKFILEDEPSLALGSISGIKFPVPYATFLALTESKPEILLSLPELYIWPLFSFLVSVSCLVLSYYRLRILFCRRIKSQVVMLVFLSAPAFIGLLSVIVSSKLDILIRINW